MADCLLDIEGVVVRFGGVFALDSCSFQVAEGSITGLVGPNGAGKSTLIESISGGTSPSGGRIVLGGTDIAGKSRISIARHGVVRTFQLPRTFDRLPVLENVVIGAGNQVGEKLFQGVFWRRAWTKQEQELRSKAERLLEWVDLGKHRLSRADSLSGGERRLLEIVRALMANPRLLLLDEPTAGVYPRVASVIATRLKELKSAGVTMLLVAHDMEFVEQVCDDVVGLAAGKVVAQGSLEAVRSNRELMRAYLGGV